MVVLVGMGFLLPALAQQKELWAAQEAAERAAEARGVETQQKEPPVKDLKLSLAPGQPVQGGAALQAVGKQTNAKFEYKVVGYWGDGNKLAEFEKTINDLAKDGWECPSTVTTMPAIVILKRPKS
jgi:hypothetical protein